MNESLLLKSRKAGTHFHPRVKRGCTRHRGRESVCVCVFVCVRERQIEIKRKLCLLFIEEFTEKGEINVSKVS